MMEEIICIPLTQGYIASIDAIDSDLADFKWYVCTNNHRWFWAARKVDHTHLLLHRVILSRILGRALLPDEECDFIDSDGLNCHRANLRLATHLQNHWNRRKPKNNTSGYKGVSWHKDQKKWRAQIQVNGRRVHLGSFDSLDDAHSAYCFAAEKFFGEFARTGE